MPIRVKLGDQHLRQEDGRACSNTQLTEFTDAQRAEALRQFQVIRPFLKDGVPLTRLATEHKLQLRTIRRWVQRYRADGLVGLIRPKRKDKGQHHFLRQIWSGAYKCSSLLS